tara:strand:- start:4840 stop:5124 length:285 start_codon:yes stop_codon:yes gene_type:complete
MTNKYAETLKDITNKIDLIDIASSPERSGALYHELDKLADEAEKLGQADANKVIAIKDSIQQSLKTLGADVDTADDSFMYEGSKYYISISKAED